MRIPQPGHIFFRDYYGDTSKIFFKLYLLGYHKNKLRNVFYHNDWNVERITEVNLNSIKILDFNDPKVWDKYIIVKVDDGTPSSKYRNHSMKLYELFDGFRSGHLEFIE